MARKVSSSRRMRESYDEDDSQRFSGDDDQLRDDGDDADDAEDADDDEDGNADDGADEEEVPVRKVKKVAKKTSRSKTGREVRQRAYWGVFDGAMKQVALFEYARGADAEKDAKERSKEKSQPHFVQIVRKNIDG
jgi:hypothetical protein